LEEAEEAIRRAGFDYEFEGKKTVTFSPGAAGPTPAGRGSAHPLEQAVPLLIKHLEERDPSVVANAAYALGALRTHAALEVMLQILGHDETCQMRLPGWGFPPFRACGIRFRRRKPAPTRTRPTFG
jgi:hypothetical protein